MIYLVEDETAIAEPIVASLRHLGYEACWFQRADAALEGLLSNPVDLLIVDVNLLDGEEAGFALVHEAREADLSMPILMLTARDAVEDRIQGLDVGADDYLAKPFDLNEFLARVRALLRRVSQVKQNQLKRGELELDFATNEVRWEQKAVRLTPREYALLEILARNPERVFSAEELVDRVWGEVENSNVVRTYIHYLRNKISNDVVEKVSGGYRLGV
ncbi:MAG: response regulator transcription factor [Trueperaceae bacterium]|nr:response regulator transcription factor [Trueperaceae bacterium]